MEKKNTPLGDLKTDYSYSFYHSFFLLYNFLEEDTENEKTFRIKVFSFFSGCNGVIKTL